VKLGRGVCLQIAVPRSMIGVVIGKGGEMIKKIQQESGARIQFRPEDELGGPTRMCNITGSQEQTQAAHNMIQELVESTAVCDSNSVLMTTVFLLENFLWLNVCCQLREYSIK